MIDFLQEVKSDKGQLKKLKTIELEQLLAQIVEKHGFVKGHSDKTGDIIAVGQGQKFLFEVKSKRAKRVGVAEARRFLSRIRKQKEQVGGLFIALSGFTSAATDFLKKNNLRSMDLEGFEKWIDSTPLHPSPSTLPRPSSLVSFCYELEVRNVRCFGVEPQVLSLCNADGKPAQWTIILGENGTGKTTLLQCIAGFDPIQSQDGSLQPKGLAFDTRRDLPAMKRVSSKQTKANSIWSISAKLAPSKSLKSAKNVSFLSQVTLEYEGSNRRLTFNTIDLDKGPSYATCFAYGASRRMGPAAMNQSLPQDTTLTLFTEDWPLRNIEEWLMQLDYASSKNSEVRKEIRQLRDRVSDILCELLPDVSSVRFAKPTRKDPRPIMQFKTSDGWLPIRSVSLGYRTFISWVVDFAYHMIRRYSERKNPLSGPALVLVDEIDLHMHPKWQRSVMQYLSKLFPNTQFIVTAHSPIFVHAASQANLAVLKRVKDKRGTYVKIENDPKTVLNWRIEQLLTSELVGLSNTFHPNIEALIDERRKLLAKKTLTKAQETRVRKLEKEIGTIPYGESPLEITTNARLDRALKVLEKRAEKKN